MRLKMGYSIPQKYHFAREHCGKPSYFLGTLVSDKPILTWKNKGTPEKNKNTTMK